MIHDDVASAFLHAARSIDAAAFVAAPTPCHMHLSAVTLHT